MLKPWRRLHRQRHVIVDKPCCINGSNRTHLLHVDTSEEILVSPPTPGDPSSDYEIASAVTCPTSWYCATSQTYVGCCEAPPATCVAFYTTCYDFLGSNCDNACLNNGQNLVW